MALTPGRLSFWTYDRQRHAIVALGADGLYDGCANTPIRGEHLVKTLHAGDF